MLVNLMDVLKYADEKKVAVGAFNTPNLENMIAVIDTAEKHNIPVIIMHAQVHEDVVAMEKIAPFMKVAAKGAKVPVCLHLDHCDNLDYLERALELGFTSVMFDGSLMDYEENIKKTKKSVELAKKYGSNVEAEIGVLGGREAGSNSNVLATDMYTDPDMAAKFVKETGIDALAASFGTAHGFYKVKPQLDFDRIKKIAELTQIPLVMHGGSGVCKEDYLKAIDCGIRKVNYYSYMAGAGVDGVKEYLQKNDAIFYHELANAAIVSMQDNVEQAMKTFHKID